MDYILFGLIVIALGLLALALILQAKQLSRLLDVIGQQRREAQDERREIINRVQFPERMPTRATGQTAVHSGLTPEQRRALSQVGTAAPQVDHGD